MNRSCALPRATSLLLTVFTLLSLSECGPDPQTEGPPEEFEELRVMSFNILYSSTSTSVTGALRQAAPDIVGLQEISIARLSQIAVEGKYYAHAFGETTANRGANDTGILSRFPIERVLTNGVVVRVNPTLKVAVFTVHLSPYPYQPYDIRDGIIITAAQAEAAAAQLRLPEIAPMLNEIAQLRQEGIPVVLTGDFNEPSHLDWTTEAAAKRMHFNMAVTWPVSSEIVAAGLTDTYRVKLPDPTSFPGNTWTTIEAQGEVYDRIDIIYFAGAELTVKDVRLVGGSGDIASIIVDGYGSDHYGVVCTFGL